MFHVLKRVSASAALTLCSQAWAATAETGGSRLVDAARKQDSQAVRILLNQKAEVNTRSEDGSTALLWAAHWNDVDTAQLLIDAGANANAGNDFKMMPL